MGAASDCAAGWSGGGCKGRSSGGRERLRPFSEDEGGERKCIGPNPLKELRIGAVSEQGSWHKFSHVNLVCKMAQEGLAPKRMDGRKNRNFCELRGNTVFCIPCPYGMFVASSLLSLSFTGVGDRKKLRHFLFHAVFRCRSFYDPGRGRGGAFSSFFREFGT